MWRKSSTIVRLVQFFFNFRYWNMAHKWMLLVYVETVMYTWNYICFTSLKYIQQHIFNLFIIVTFFVQIIIREIIFSILICSFVTSGEATTSNSKWVNELNFLVIKSKLKNVTVNQIQQYACERISAKSTIILFKV